MPSVRKRLRYLAPTRLKKLVSRDTHGVCMAQSHVAYFLFCFCEVNASWERGARSIQQDFQLSIQALGKLDLKVKTTELYQPRYKHREI
jgi:hypothetical protein